MVARMLVVAMLLALCLTACRGGGGVPATAPAALATTTPPTAPATATTTPPLAASPSPSRLAAATPLPYPTMPLPAGCDEAATRRVVGDFIAAFNAGDRAGLARVFPARGSDGDHPWTGDPNQLRWFTLTSANPGAGVDALNLHTPEALLAYFGERHARHERMALVELVVNPAGGGPGMAAINFRITRVADDLPESAFGGKGGVGCANGRIFLWSQGAAFDGPDTPRPLASATATALATPAAANCPATPYAPGPPTGSESDRAIAGLRGGQWYGGDGLWAFPWLGGEPPGTLYLNSDGTHKVLWWREPGVEGVITVTARRLDAPAAPIAVDFEGNPTRQGQQPGGLQFPAPGCWEITGTAGGKSLTFVALVVPRPLNNTATRAIVPAPDCAVSPDATHAANGHLLSGKRGGGMFIYPAAGRVFAAHRPEKFLVFLDPLPTSPPSPLLVHGRNRSTGTATVFENARHLSEYGTEWGTNYVFPEAGCWELRVDEQGSRGMVVILVLP